MNKWLILVCFIYLGQAKAFALTDTSNYTTAYIFLGNNFNERHNWFEHSIIFSKDQKIILQKKEYIKIVFKTESKIIFDYVQIPKDVQLKLNGDAHPEKTFTIKKPLESKVFYTINRTFGAFGGKEERQPILFNSSGSVISKVKYISNPAAARLKEISEKESELYFLNAKEILVIEL